MNKIWFTSDHHFFHEKVIKLCGRPFHSMEYMHCEIIRRWNERVKENDTVYVLGDMFFNDKGKEIIDIFAQLNGKVFVVPGNHDSWVLNSQLIHDMKSRSKFGVTILPSIYRLSLQTNAQSHLKIILCHYPLREWQGKNKGAFHLYGHSHGNAPGLGYSFDVGVDNFDFYPISSAYIVYRIARGF